MKKTLLTFFYSSLLLMYGCTANTPDSAPERQAVASVVATVTAGATTDAEKMEAIYYFVRDEIEFGWVYPQVIPAEETLQKRRGVCMQKSNLLVAMAREAGLKARFHFMYVRKTALEDLLPPFAYSKWVDPFPHTFPEVHLNGKWVSMEATFDRKLHQIMQKEKLNFGRHPAIRQAVNIEFSVNGVKGHQQYAHVEGKESFYGEDLSEFTEYLHSSVPWWKRLLQPIIFTKAQQTLDVLRNSDKESPTST